MRFPSLPPWQQPGGCLIPAHTADANQDPEEKEPWTEGIKGHGEKALSGPLSPQKCSVDVYGGFVTGRGIPKVP